MMRGCIRYSAKGIVMKGGFFLLIMLCCAGFLAAVPTTPPDGFSQTRSQLKKELNRTILFPASEHTTSERFDFVENTVWPVLEGCTKYLTKYEDEEIANLLMLVVLSWTQSAEESFSFALGDVFVSKPDFLSRMVGNFGPEERNWLINSIDWGIQNVEYDAAGVTRESLGAARRKLEALRKAQPPSGRPSGMPRP